jgi:hypothetical protein
MTIRRRARIGTTLPGGAIISLVGYLPERECNRCRARRSAAEFIRHVKIVDGRRTAFFGHPCIECSKPKNFPSDLRGLRFTDTYDVDGKLIGWVQRDKRGRWGGQLSLRLMRVRLVGGVLLPQPKINRSVAGVRVYIDAPPIVDPTRLYSPEQLQQSIHEQGGTCCYCRQPFTLNNPAVGEHKKPYSHGWRTNDDNRAAACRSCNSKKGAKYEREFRSYLKVNPPQRRMPLFEG